jgi:uroporphyrin-III C-methyltransferase
MSAGKVYLVGAGPGDPGLITVRGLELLRSADVVVYDRLINPILLEQARVNTELVFVGKHSSYHSLPQEQINELLISHARNGRHVVRLKGGDPFVFGRGGEEGEALRAAGIPFEVIPGVSSAVAVPAYAGIPLTHRGLSSSFAVITGHEACKAKASVDWGLLARSVDTLVVLMGLKSLPDIAAKLIDHGRPAATPVALIRCGTTDKQEVIIGTLADIGARASALSPPVLAVIGEVVKLSEDLKWFTNSYQSGELFHRELWPAHGQSPVSESVPRPVC